MIKNAAADGAPAKRPRLEEKEEVNGTNTPVEPQVKKPIVQWVEKGTLLSISEDGLMVTGTKGYCMARTNASVKRGVFYYEIKLLPSAEPYHVRFGWGTKKADINAPVGFDEYSYGYRDIGGVTVHKSRRSEQYGDPFGAGDVVGTLICVNWEEKPVQEPTITAPSLPGRFIPPSLVKQISDSTPSSPRIDKASYIRFFVNGKDQGIAFESLPFDSYYPCVSIYGGGSIRANFGPSFEFPPEDAEAVPPT